MTNRRFIIVFAGGFLPFLTLLLISGCSKNERVIDSGMPPSGDVTYADVAPIFNANCAKPGCHASPGQNGLVLESYNDILAGSASGDVVISGDPGSSLLYQRITLPDSDPFRMPQQPNPPLSAGDKELIRRWIEDGLQQ
jgi:hypothetical protein